MIEPRTAARRAARMFLMLVAGCVAVIGAALYLQHWQGLDPCPWCIVQRLVYIAIGVVGLVAALVRPGGIGITVFSALGGLLALAGAAAATWHVFLQKDPERAQSCTGSVVEKLLDASRLGHLAPDLLQYDGPCTLKPWSLLGMSIPEWSLIGFVAILVWMVVLPRFARR